MDSLPNQLQVIPRQSSFFAGEKVAIAVPHSLFNGAEEFELLLKAHGLKAELVRLTPSYLAQNRVVTFKVPNLPGARARLVLRAGAGGREWLVATSEEFFIVASHSRDIPTLVKRKGEWWFDASPGLRQTEYLQGWESEFPVFLPWYLGPRSPEHSHLPPAGKASPQNASRLLIADHPRPGVRPNQLCFPKRE